MKKKNMMKASLFAFFILTAASIISSNISIVSAAETYKNGTVVPSEKVSSVRNAAREKSMASYYITSGKNFDKAVATLQGLDSKATGLTPDQKYSYRMDKPLTGDYFYHVKAFLADSPTVSGDYLLAKDDSCVYRRFPGENRVELLAGTTEKLMEKVEIYALYRKIPMGSATKVFIRVPGNIPYTMELTSLDENMIEIRKDESGQPLVYGIARGKADVLAEVTIGEFSKTKKVNYIIMDEKDMEREENRSSGGFPFGIGIGIGIGRGRHHGGGVVIGI